MLCCSVKDVVEVNCTVSVEQRVRRARKSQEVEALGGFDLEGTLYGVSSARFKPFYLLSGTVRPRITTRRLTKAV